jgi:hypothetical protein
MQRRKIILISAKLCRTNSSFLHLHTWRPEDNDGFRSGCGYSFDVRSRTERRPASSINFILVPPNAFAGKVVLGHTFTWDRKHW